MDERVFFVKLYSIGWFRFTLVLHDLCAVLYQCNQYIFGVWNLLDGYLTDILYDTYTTMI